MGIFDNLFGSSQNVTSSRPQPMEGLEKLTPTLYNLTNTAATRPYAKNPNIRLAPFSQSQQAGMAGIRGVATDPRYGRQLGNAESLIGSSADDARLSGMIGSLGRTIKPQSWTDKGTAGAYMNPYTENVLDRLLRREDERTGERRAGLDAKLAGKGAFGDRGDLARAQFERDEENRKADMIADQYAKAYDTGSSIFRSDADRGLQAEDLMTRGIGQGTTAENSRLAGRRAAGNDMSQLADRWRTGMTENAKNLLGIGQMEQQQAQKNLDLQTKDFEEQRDFPEDRANFTARILYGSPTGQKTTTPGPSLGSQILGAGIGGYGLGQSFGWWKKGGAVRLASGGMSDDGISDDDLLSMLRDPDVDDTTKESIKERLRAGNGIGMMPPPPKPMMPKAPMAASPGDTDVPLPPPGPAATGGVRPSMMSEPASPSPEPDRYSSILERLLEAQKPNKGMILARIGAAMMSGQKPGFLANVGEGIGAGVRGMEDEQQRRLRSLGTMASIEERRQTAKERAEDRKRADRIREEDLKERGEDRKTQRELQRERIENEKLWREAQLGQGDWRQIGVDGDGNAVVMNSRTSEQKSLKGIKPSASDRSTEAERTAAALMEEDPTLTRREAMEIAKGTKSREAIAKQRLENQREEGRRKFISESTLGGMRPMTPAQQAEEVKLYGPRPDRSGATTTPAPAAPAAPPAPAAPKPPPAAGGATPPAPAVEMLKKDPARLRAAFDLKYGAGAAARVLGE